MSLKFLKPVTITTAMLISSTRAETDHRAISGQVFRHPVSFAAVDGQDA